MNRLNRRYRGVAVFAAVVALGVVVVFGYSISRERAIDRSLVALLDGQLSLRYEIRQRVVENRGPDALAWWWIEVTDPAALALIRTRPGFGLADAADLAHARRAFGSHAPAAVPLEDYELVRGEVTLGEGSICEQSHCNVEILASPHHRGVFVQISKT